MASAKRAGTYDIGIKTITGHSVSIQKPRSFCFRGVDAKSPQDRVLLYKAVVDKGMESSVAVELYNESKALEDNNNGGSGNFGSQRRGIKSGFYFDKRTLTDGSPMFKETEKRVFLIINQGRSRNTCVVARPSYGKFLATKEWVKESLLYGAPRLSLVTDQQEAIDLWDQEFKLADCPSSETYQRYSWGRHAESFVFSGSVIPVLNKILVSSARHGSELVMPAIVRVEPKSSQESEANEDQPGVEQDTTTTNSSEADGTDDTDSTTDKEPAVGQKVAIEMLGSIIFRGVITEVRNLNKLITHLFQNLHSIFCSHDNVFCICLLTKLVQGR